MTTVPVLSCPIHSYAGMLGGEQWMLLCRSLGGSSLYWEKDYKVLAHTHTV